MAERTTALYRDPDTGVTSYIGIESVYTVAGGKQINIPEKIEELRKKSRAHALFCPCGCGSRLILVAGDRAADMAVRVKYAGVAPQFIEIQRDYEKLVSWMEEQEHPVFIIPTYTAMLELRQAVVHKVGGAEFWEK